MTIGTQNTRHIDEQLSLYLRGTQEIIREDELKNKLIRSHKENKPLIVKAGFDPSAPDLHLGHTVLIQKMKQFQSFGHTVVFLIGDFTGMIGDPSGKSKTRKALSQQEVVENAKTYKEQVFKILDPQKTVVDFNSRWMGDMPTAKFIELTSHYTLARLLERDDFSKRFENEEPITIRELMYPLIQGYDSVMLKADVELGGTDQKFNLLVGRELQKAFGLEPQVVLTMPLLEGLDGVQKMSKSLKNAIGISESPKDMFGKVMSLSDTLMLRYYELLSDISTPDLENLKKDLKAGKAHPRDTKIKLGQEMVERFYSNDIAQKTVNDFIAQFSEKKLPTDMPVVSAPEQNQSLAQYLKQVGLVPSTTEAKRMCSQSAVRKIEKGSTLEDAKTLTDANAVVQFKSGDIINVGKRVYAKVK